MRAISVQHACHSSSVTFGLKLLRVKTLLCDEPCAVQATCSEALVLFARFVPGGFGQWMRALALVAPAGCGLPAAM
jgi:hypothetical protein